MNDIDETKDLHRDKWKHLKKKNKAGYTATEVAWDSLKGKTKDYRRKKIW